MGADRAFSPEQNGAFSAFGVNFDEVGGGQVLFQNECVKLCYAHLVRLDCAGAGDGVLDIRGDAGPRRIPFGAGQGQRPLSIAQRSLHHLNGALEPIERKITSGSSLALRMRLDNDQPAVCTDGSCGPKADNSLITANVVDGFAAQPRSELDEELFFFRLRPRKKAETSPPAQACRHAASRRVGDSIRNRTQPSCDLPTRPRHHIPKYRILFYLSR